MRILGLAAAGFSIILGIRIMPLYPLREPIDVSGNTRLTFQTDLT
ncbi:hypothetical protein Psta_4319 [Pirellula staleyi DSM 6068]|uniref:Uncharacterized protein n=1 Tax=Pirellula staleyi (strain ATCC 27377 / DSM 6068 / ICPB 4128) TaxID=530564 RepID=D2R504_PIRSD|nr:hypothetical protein Psta_4319 [Pirellula staleyi DSM 6068]